jgi:8-hydroxy-5-deazaflavin:NADPH oxidoreductase
MKITVIGRGNVGGGLARFWRAAGHDVQELGRDGGDASGADVVVVAVPGDLIADALARVSGLSGKVAIDTTNAVRGRPDGFESLAHQVKSVTGGPVAKAFNTVFATTYDAVGEQRVRPSSFVCGDDEALPVVEQLVTDAGFDPVVVGGLEHAVNLEDFVLNVIFPVAQSRKSPFFYRVAGPGEL